MEPTRNTQVTLVDLLDRVLDKGLVINADVIISVAGIPLIGVNLRAALAGMETMLKYGLMRAWDEKIRAEESNNRLTKPVGTGHALSSNKNINLTKSKQTKLDFLTEGEMITHRGRAWHMVSSESIWKPGHLYITNKRLCWWYDFEKRLAFEISREKILGSVVEVKNLSPALKRKKVFDVIYSGATKRRVASFSGKKMYEWERALARIISFREKTEACPQCKKKAIVLELLEKGCPNCGWVSPRLKKKLAKVVAK